MSISKALRITPDQVRPWLRAAPDFAQTEQLKDDLQQSLRKRGTPVYLTREELDRILDWKLGEQRARIARYLRSNTDQVVRAVTRHALNVTCDENPSYELELRVNALATLRGVGIGVASAILALVYPTQYAVIDYRGWRQAFGEDKTGFSIADYQRYLDALRTLAPGLPGESLQAIDAALWAKDKHEHGRSIG